MVGVPVGGDKGPAVERIGGGRAAPSEKSAVRAVPGTAVAPALTRPARRGAQNVVEPGGQGRENGQRAPSLRAAPPFTCGPPTPLEPNRSIRSAFVMSNA